MSNLRAISQKLLKDARARITCVVCKRSNQACSSRARVCQDCNRDMAATVCHIDRMRHAAENRVDRTRATFEQARVRAPEALHARFAAYTEARIAEHPNALLAETAARFGSSGPLSDRIRLWLDYQDAGEAYHESQQWAVQCAGALQ